MTGLTNTNFKIVQIHPTLRCNLKCLHCYSSSSPQESTELDVGILREGLSDAWEQGYRVASFSGGEPTLYKDLHQLLEYAHQLGMRTTVTSNGMLLDEDRLNTLRDVTDILAISLDGMPDSHNKMRGSERAFDAMVSRLEGVRQSKIPFGFIFTLTQYNVNELDWVANFAIEQKAALLQIHPLETVGRAFGLLAGSAPDQTELTYAFIESLRIQSEMGDRLFVQIDVIDRNTLRSHPSIVSADGIRQHSVGEPLADIISPLIIRADGVVVPVDYGIDTAYAIGNLRDARLNQLAANWKQSIYPQFAAIYDKIFQEVTAPSEQIFLDWYATFGNKIRDLSTRV